MKIPVYSPTANTQNTQKSARLAIKFVRFRASRYALYLMLFAHGTAILSVSIISVPIGIRLILFLLLLLYLAKNTISWLRLPTMRMQCVSHQWYLVDEVSHAKSQIIDWHFLSNWALVLVVKTPIGRRRYFPVFRDSCSYEHFRWTRVVANYLLESSDS